MRLESLGTAAPHLRDDIDPEPVNMPGPLLAAILSGLGLGAALLTLGAAGLSQLWQAISR